MASITFAWLIYASYILCVQDKVQELHEIALHGALDVYDKEAVGVGDARQNHRKLLITDLRERFQVHLT